MHIEFYSIHHYFKVSMHTACMQAEVATHNTYAYIQTHLCEKIS